MENPETKPKDPPPAAKRRALAVAVVTDDPRFHAAALSMCADLAAGGLVADGEMPTPATEPEEHPLYAEALQKARAHLGRTAALAITVVQASTLDAVAARLGALGAAPGPLGMLFLDGGAGGQPRLEDDDAAALEARLEAFYARLAAAGVTAIRSPYAAVLHRRTAPWAAGVHALADRLVERVIVPASPWLFRTEMLVALVDFVERTFDKPRNHKAALRDMPTTLGDELTRFLGDRAGSDWLFFYYTGSSVTPLIDHLERAAEAQGALVLRAANEHGLACGALANHLLHGRPSLFVIGTAMMDEFRGTLANLRSAGARGFIVCPEADLGSWFTFQGTITVDEDMREAVTARRLPVVYLDSTDTLPQRLEEAFRLYEEGRGPVALLVTQAILDAREPLARRPAYPPRVVAGATAAPAGGVLPVLAPAQEEALDRVLSILNRERTKVLWQLGRLDEEELGLALRIAERAGVALVDTLGHPQPTHRDGRHIKNHLGTLGLYGFNQRSYAFLHDAGGKLSPKAESCIFFLKSRVGGRATNFTPARRAGLRMIQLTHRADHVAPDVELGLVMDAKDFLRRVLARLDVDPEVLRHRELAIEASARDPVDLMSRIPSLPMSPNYFFRELGALFERLIEHEGYTYTGIYDVGRSSVSATRAVPRTARGFSGWYGRALMGDAPAALPTLAITEPGNVVAFVGDGARSIIADPIPPLLDNALAYPSRADKNITLFYFSNGTFSGIRMYRERLAGRWGGRQMRTIDLLPEEGERRFGPLVVSRRLVTTFDGDALRAALTARGRLNVFTVLLGHNNDDDGFSFVTAGWQRDAGSP